MHVHKAKSVLGSQKYIFDVFACVYGYVQGSRCTYTHTTFTLRAEMHLV